MPDISFKVDVLSDAARDNIGFKNAAGVQQYIPKLATDSSGNTVGIADPVGGVIYFGGNPYTWATRPAAAGNTGQVIRVSDVGTGLGGSHWVSDGTYWRPVGGSVVIGAQSGSIATPVSSFTGVTSSQFTPTKQPVFPAGMLIPGQSSIEVEAIFRRTGATATATLNAHLGTAKTSGDSAIYAFNYPATNLADLIVNPTVFIAETARFTSTNWQPKGGSSNTNVTNDKTGNVNTAADMGVTFSISGANIADSFALIGYRVRLSQ